MSGEHSGSVSFTVLGGLVASCSCGWCVLGLRTQDSAYRRLAKHLNAAPPSPSTNSPGEGSDE